MTIWHHTPNLEELNKRSRNTINEILGVEFTAFDDQSITATMPVDARTHQPYGILHGGASVVLAESVGSAASNLCLNGSKQYSVGLDINANHLRAVSSGTVTATARPVHLGRRTHVWSIEIVDEKHRPSCISRLTMAVLDREPEN